MVVKELHNYCLAAPACSHTLEHTHKHKPRNTLLPPYGFSSTYCCTTVAVFFMLCLSQFLPSAGLNPFFCFVCVCLISSELRVNAAETCNIYKQDVKMWDLFSCWLHHLKWIWGEMTHFWLQISCKRLILHPEIHTFKLSINISINNIKGIKSTQYLARLSIVLVVFHHSYQQN